MNEIIQSIILTAKDGYSSTLEEIIEVAAQCDVSWVKVEGNRIQVFVGYVDTDEQIRVTNERMVRVTDILHEWGLSVGSRQEYDRGGGGHYILVDAAVYVTPPFQRIEDGPATAP